jgi:tetratricopeptide (TPR) repeat protein
MTQRIGEEAIEDLIGFVEEAIDQILLREDETEFFAWVRAEAPRRFEEDFARLPGEQAVRATVFGIAREIWNKVPLPGAGYRVRSIPRAERNDRCPCGSGQKHKRCCGATSGGRLAMPLTVEDGWHFVLLRRPPEEVARISSEGLVPRAFIPSLADHFLEIDEPEAALALLEPFFEEPERLTERDALAVEALIDAYDALELHDRKGKAIERLGVALPPPLRLVLWESLSPSLAARGETGGTWEAGLGDMRETVDSLEKLLRDLADRPIRPYAVLAEDFVGLLLTPDEVAMIEHQWMAATIDVEWERPEEAEEDGDGLEMDEDDEVTWFDEEMWASDQVWPAWLERTPQAFDSLLVLSNLATGALILAQKEPALRETLLVPLVARGLAILDASLAGAPQVTALPGDLKANVPALELLDISARLSQPALDIKALERLLALDPADSLEVRGELAVTYLEAGEPQKTLDLAAFYTGDKETSFLTFARVIALHQLHRAEEAFAVLDEALSDYPYTAFMVATAAPLSTISEVLTALCRSEEELWRRLQKWLEEREPGELNGLIGN